MSDNTPETRIELSNHSRRAKNRGNEEKAEPQKTMIKLFNKDGKPNNINEAKISFSFEEDEENNSFVLTLMIYKYVCNLSVFTTVRSFCISSIFIINTVWEHYYNSSTYYSEVAK